MALLCLELELEDRVMKQYCRLGRLTTFGFAIITLAFLYTFRYQLAGLYGKDQSSFSKRLYS